MSKRSKKRASRQEGGLRQWLTTERVIIGGIVLATVVLVAVIVVDAASRQRPDIDVANVEDRSVAVPIQGANHIGVNEPHEPYNSNPPTSGPHAASVSTDVYTRQLPDENLVHNLEHGHIWLSYQDLNDEEVFDMLSDIQRRFPRTVIVTYRPGNDSRVAAAAWGRLLKLNGEINPDEIYAFIERYNNRAPESIPG